MAVPRIGLALGSGSARGWSHIGEPMALLVAAFVFGGLLDGFYTLGLVVFASNMTSSQIIGGNACLVGMCGLGEIVGPVATEAGMSAWGPVGLPIVVAALLVVFLLLVLTVTAFNRGRRGPSAEALVAVAPLR